MTPPIQEDFPIAGATAEVYKQCLPNFPFAGSLDFAFL